MNKRFGDYLDALKNFFLELRKAAGPKQAQVTRPLPGDGERATGRSENSPIALSSRANPAQLQAEKKVTGSVKLKLFIYLPGFPAFASAGGEKHFQHPRCKNQLNCQIPGTEPRAGGKTPRRHLLSKSSCPTLPTRVTDGGGKRRPGHPRARPPGLPGSGAGGAQTETAPERFTRGFASIVL